MFLLDVRQSETIPKGKGSTDVPGKTVQRVGQHAIGRRIEELLTQIWVSGMDP